VSPLGRRAFLQLAAASALVRPSRAAAETETSALGVHRATRNTWHGPSGLGSLFTERPLSYKPYPGAARTPLPDGAATASASLVEVVGGYNPALGFSGEPIPLALLAQLLRLTNGVTGTVQGSDPPEHRRAAPSAGALYAGELYVVAERVDGLAPGVYSYAVAEHELVSIRGGAALGEVAAALETPASIAGAACGVLLTNVFQRYAWRYGPRGYRYALIDSGHIGENLRLAATAAGLGHASLLRFHDDALNTLLGIDGREEAVCALHVLGRSSAARAAPARRTLVERGVADRSLAAVERYHEATKLVPGRAVPAAAAATPVEPPPQEAALTLPTPPAPTLPVARAIQQRRSARGFREDVITLEALSFASAMARGPGLGVRLVAHRVHGLAPGLYESLPGAHALRTLRAGSLEGQLVRACLFQERAGSAAAAFAWVADLGRAAPAGERCYRDQLLEAGAAAERLYLAAESLGLAARNLAAFFDDSLDDLLGLDGRERAVIHFTLLGHETEAATLGP
jgi:SagB-type dehydrogenase family enzyme